MPDPASDAKRALRAELRERRRQFSDDARDRAAQGLRTQLDALVAARGARAVSCYLATSIEPPTGLFVDDATGRGIRVLLPVTRTDGLLDWVVDAPDADHVTGTFGVPEPVGELLGPIAVNDVDLMLIPAAAVDRHGTRLGWGRGYYDKTIGSMQSCPPVYAIVYDSELVDDLPHELHDQRVDGVITPTRTIDFAPVRR